MSDTPGDGGADGDDRDDEGAIITDAVCPGCGAEAAEQIRETLPVYKCRVCGTEFDPSGEQVDIE